MPPAQQHGSFRENITAGIALCQLFSLQGEIWCRWSGTAGIRHFGTRAGIGWVMLVVIASFSQSELMLGFWLATGVMYGVNRIVQASKRRDGYRVHSHYIGDSIFAGRFTNPVAARWIEPAFMGLIGIAFIEAGDPAGMCFVALGFAMFVSAGYCGMIEDAERMALEDARHDQERIRGWMQNP